MPVEYIQAVCPHCGHGLYVTAARGDASDEFYCQIDGVIDPQFVRYVLCKEVGGKVEMMAPYCAQEMYVTLR